MRRVPQAAEAGRPQGQQHGAQPAQLAQGVLHRRFISPLSLSLSLSLSFLRLSGATHARARACPPALSRISPSQTPPGPRLAPCPLFPRRRAASTRPTAARGRERSTSSPRTSSSAPTRSPRAPTAVARRSTPRRCAPTRNAASFGPSTTARAARPSVTTSGTSTGRTAWRGTSRSSPRSARRGTPRRPSSRSAPRRCDGSSWQAPSARRRWPPRNSTSSA